MISMLSGTPPYAALCFTMVMRFQIMTGFSAALKHSADNCNQRKSICCFEKVIMPKQQKGLQGSIAMPTGSAALPSRQHQSKLKAITMLLAGLIVKLGELVERS